MFGLIIFFAVAGYFVYNLMYMSRHDPINFWDGLYMFFCQGAEDFYYWVKEKIGK